MASQLASNTRCQTLMHCTASYGERGSGSRRRGGCKLSHRYRRITNHGSDNDEGSGNASTQQEQDLNKKKGAKQQLAQKLHRLGFSYLASSFIYVVTKVKAFYNGFLGDVSNQPNAITAMEAQLTEPYFSFPVLPYN
ncbi:hypothetical protein AAHE18_15G020500 [Arachis hypogaea]|uniref:Uncharacterized protein n=1 Tax=Arachis hypogaea TaxID=3818 RepID=A0A444WVC3_ARAHY|nr:uncharacterized protein LOC112747558 isoform X1 [Arachis hypogaea]QHO40175.1 uncharacterized protein DS421_5g135310 [Arachis hypogaea]RYQ81339.1 hypothetical protein Ahy_Scaffold1g107302 [Arachis hypogaea]